MAKIFIGSSTEALKLAKKIRLLLQDHHDVHLWNDHVFKPGHYWIDSLKFEAHEVDFGIILATADDTTVSRSTKFFSPRDNILLEIGMFMGTLEKERVLLVVDEAKKPKLPTDIVGLEPVRIYGNDVKAACAAILNHIKKLGPRKRALAGKRLFQHTGYYPVELAKETRIPSFSKDKFVKAVTYFLRDVEDTLAVTDLAYLWEMNKDHLPDRLSRHERALYESLIKKYDVKNLIERFHHDHNRIFRNYIQIVNDVGDTLKGVFFEILLHDVRNPLQSIIAARGTESVSNRRIGDPSTRFVVQYVEEGGERLLEAVEHGDKVSYLKRFDKTKWVKATTTFIKDDVYSLVGILCINIDIDAVKALSVDGAQRFLKSYIENSGKTLKFEDDMFDKKKDNQG